MKDVPKVKLFTIEWCPSEAPLTGIMMMMMSTDHVCESPGCETTLVFGWKYALHFSGMAAAVVGN